MENRKTEKQVKALAMRLAGSTYRQIGESFGITGYAARWLVTKELQRLANQETTPFDLIWNEAAAETRSGE